MQSSWFFKKVDLFFFLLIIQMGVHTPSPLKEEAITLALNGFKKIVNLNCFFLYASNKNEQKSNRNLKAMIGATRT